MAARVVITYDDGTVKTVNPARPKLLYRFEIEFGKSQPDKWSEVCWLAWQASGDATSTSDLETWLDTVAEIETVDEPPAEPPPVTPGKAASSRPSRGSP